MTFENEYYSIELDEENGAITSLESCGKQFVGKIVPLFELRLRKGGDTVTLLSDKANSFKISRENNAVLLLYSDFSDADIQIGVKLITGKRLEWYIGFTNNSTYAVEYIRFPQIDVPNDLVSRGGSGKLLLNFNEGLLCEDISKVYRLDLEYPSCGLMRMFPAVVESQFMAYFDATKGLYFAAEDKNQSIKGVDFYADDENSIRLQFQLYPGVFASQTDFEFGYPVVMDFFEGDWIDAAELYRKWLEVSLPAEMKKLHEEKMPEWYCDSPLVVTYPVQGIHDMDETVPNKLFPYNNSLPILDGIAKETGSRIMALLMHWEGTAPWAPPYVWPPLGGEKLLSDFCHKLHDRDFLLGVYCSGTGFTLQSNLKDYNTAERFEKENLGQYMCTAPDGSLPFSYICRGQRKGYDMCISQDFTKDTLCSEAEKMASAGLDYIQILDQNHGGTPYFCFGDKHSHPPVPGLWQVKHMKNLLSRLNKSVGENILLGCESAAAESYIPYLKLSDNRFNLNFRFGRPVPLYAYLYHEYVNNFSGNSVCTNEFIDEKRTPDCLVMRQAYSFIAGDLMTLVINQDGKIVWNWGERDFSYLPNEKNVLSFIRSATAYRRKTAKKFLAIGKMIHPFSIKCDIIPVYKPGRKEADAFYPCVFTSAWQCEDGEKAQLFANYTDEDRLVEVVSDSGFEAELVSPDGKTVKAVNFENPYITIPPCSVAMVKFKTN